MAPSKCIDMGKTWPVYTVRLRALGCRACICPRARIWLKYSACNIKGTVWSHMYVHVLVDSCIYM